MSPIREHWINTLTEWVALPGYKPDLDAAEREHRFVSEYVRTYFRLPPHAEREVEDYHARQKFGAMVDSFDKGRRAGWSIFDMVIE